MGEYTVQFEFPDVIEGYVWEIDGNHVLPSRAFSAFCRDIDVVENGIQDRCRQINQTLDGLDWRRRQPVGILLDYSDVSFSAVMAGNKAADPNFEEDVAHAGQQDIEGVAFGGCSFDKLVVLSPARLRRSRFWRHKGTRREFALHVLTHELVHASGVGHGCRGLSTEKIELMTDAVSFMVGWRNWLPDKYHAFFGYLKQHADRPTTSGTARKTKRHH